VAIAREQRVGKGEGENSRRKWFVGKAHSKSPSVLHTEKPLLRNSNDVHTNTKRNCFGKPPLLAPCDIRFRGSTI